MNDTEVVEDGEHFWSNAEYHARKNILGHSLAVDVLDDTAKMAWILTHSEEPTPALVRGSAWHSFMLENGKDIRFVDSSDWRSKEARSAKIDAEDAGLIPMLVKDLEVLRQAQNVLVSDPDMGSYLTDPNGKAERSFVVTPDWVVGNRFQVKARPDWLIESPNEVVVIDYKTTRDASEKGFSSVAGKRRYFVQDAWYRRVLAQHFGCDPWADIDFIFLAQETEPPFYARLHRLPTVAVDAGMLWCDTALKMWGERGGCNPEGWPSTGYGISTLRVSDWDLRIPDSDVL